MIHTDLDRHCKTLGVSAGASASAVKSAYRRAAKAAHPDVAGPDSAERMVAINAAYVALRSGVPAIDASQEPTGKTRLAPRTLAIPESARELFRARAMVELKKLDILPHDVSPMRGFLNRVLRRKPKGAKTPVLHIPHQVAASGTQVHFKLDVARLSMGEQALDVIVLPVLTIRDERLLYTGSVRLVTARTQGDRWLDRWQVPEDIANNVMPEWRGVKMFISSLRV